MIREEAINVLNRLKSNDVSEVNDSAYCIGEALTMAIEALKQEPCEDAVSRKAIIDVFRTTEDAEHATWTLKGIENEINEMPSVTPIRPKGHWYWKDSDDYYCSVCNKPIARFMLSEFCPNCGADMKEVEE